MAAFGQFAICSLIRCYLYMRTMYIQRRLRIKAERELTIQMEEIDKEILADLRLNLTKLAEDQ